MGKRAELRVTDRPTLSRNRPSKQTPEAIGRRLLRIVVYDKQCRIGGMLTLDDLAETEIGDWLMPEFKTACSCATSQDWLIVSDDMLTLTTARLGCGLTIMRLWIDCHPTVLDCRSNRPGLAPPSLTISTASGRDGHLHSVRTVGEMSWPDGLARASVTMA
jgi:hypothetical protein